MEESNVLFSITFLPHVEDIHLSVSDCIMRLSRGQSTVKLFVAQHILDEILDYDVLSTHLLQFSSLAIHQDTLALSESGTVFFHLRRSESRPGKFIIVYYITTSTASCMVILGTCLLCGTG
jgi:hypothetical protein